MNPFFSVVISLYNKEFYVKQTLLSALNQTFEDFEIIVINDGSTDTSFDEINDIKDSRLTIYSTENRGVSYARNYGISLSKGKYIALLDGDDLWYDNHLSELKLTIEKFPEADLFSNNYEIYYGNDFVRPAKFSFNYKTLPLIVEDYFSASRINSVIWTSSSCFTKDSFNLIGKFNTDLITGQDIDLWIRYALNYKIAFNPKRTMRYYFNTSSNLSKSNYNHNRYLLINNFQKEESLNPSLKAFLDLNRYAVAIRAKLNGELDLYKKLETNLDQNNINFIQNSLLRTPRFILIALKKIHSFLIKKRFYISSFK